MTAFLTCRSCAKRQSCSVRDNIRSAIKGLRITTIRHTCAAHELPYAKGQAVWAKVQQCPVDSDADYYGRTPSKEWFPAHFIEVSMRSNTRGLVFIPFEAPSRDNPTILFYPVRESEEGAVCRVIWEFIEPRDAPAAPECEFCKQLRGMKCEGSEYGPPCPFKEP